MQAVELGTQRILGRRGLDGNHLRAQNVHARAHSKFRRERERKHHDYQNRSRRNRPMRTRAEPESGQNVNDRRSDADVVQPREGVSDHGSRLIEIRQNPEHARRFDKTEKNDRANPRAQREELQEAQKAIHQRSLSQGGTRKRGHLNLS